MQFVYSTKVQLEHKCIADERQCNTGRKLPLYLSAQAISKLSNFCNCCYRVRQKRQRIEAKNAKNTRIQISPFALLPIGHCGEKFNIGAQLHLFRYRMASNVCAKVQDLG